MPLRNPSVPCNTDELKQRVSDMHKFYFKGLASDLSLAVQGAEYYAWAKQRADASRGAEVAQQGVCSLNQIYSHIPFDKLRGNADYYPLFAARNALKLADGNLKEALVETDSEIIKALAVSISGNLHIMADWGRVYRARINLIFDEIHAIEGNKNFKLEVIDTSGTNLGKLPRV